MNNILVTGGAGFIGSNLIKSLIKKHKNINIVSLDNYFTGSIENHIEGVEYIQGNTWDANIIFKNRTFDTVFHFGEYSRIVQSFRDINTVSKSILYGTPTIQNLCKRWNAKLIYSASSSKFGNDGKDEDLSPYSWSKSKNIELIKNYNKWFGLNYELVFFYNVYGPRQIINSPMSAVIGIFENQYNKKKSLTVVKPGNQRRDFTHVNDIVDGLIKIGLSSIENEDAWELGTGTNYSINELFDFFSLKFK